MKKFYTLVASLLLSATALGATFQYFNPAAGILKGNPSTYVTTAAVSSDILATFSGTCNSTTFMRGDGSCQTPPGAGGGTVNSVGLSAPSVFSVTGSPITNTGTLTLNFATGQTANSFLATPDGTTGALSLRTVVNGDLPTVNAAHGGTGVTTLTGIAKGNGTSAFSVAGSSDVIATWSGTCSSSTFLRGDGSCQTPATGTGTVTSVALTVPSGFSVTGSPVTTSGTLAISGTLNPAAGGTGVATLTGIAKGNGTSAFSVAASGDVTGLWGGTCNSGTYLRGDGTCATPPTGGTSANPTATIGLTAVNGSAGTFLRSDGAPALSQAIAPTWSAQHIFGLTNATGALQINTTVPILTWNESAAASGSRLWRSLISSSTMQFDVADDTASNVNPWLTVGRSAGNVGTITQYTGAGVARTTLNSTGNFVINAPTSGVALTVNGVAGSSPLIVNAANNIASVINMPAATQSIPVDRAGTTTAAMFDRFTNTGATLWTGVENSGGNTLFTGLAAYSGVIGTQSNTPMALGSNGAERLRVAAAGNVTINAPSSGTALTVTAAASSDGVQITQASTNGLVITCGACSSTDNASIKLTDGSDAWSLGSDDSLNYAWFRNVNSGNDLITFDTSDRVAFPVVGTTATAANAVIDNGNGNRLLRSTSSRRYKKDITPLGNSLNGEVMKLQAVRYHSKAEADSKTDWYYGLIAEDVAAVEPRLVVYDKDGRPDGVQYDRVGVLLLSVVQEQQEQIKALREELNALKKKVH